MDAIVSGGTEGVIFDIQHYSIHDGPGIRTNVFMKGCPLNCLWCQNPESQSAKHQIMYNSGLCAGCGLCIETCEKSAISRVEDKVKTDRTICTGCGRCIPVCRQEARSISGRKATVGEVYKEVAKDKLFYSSSNGGITVSGGEPLMQASFTRDLLCVCRENGITTCIETCGFTEWKIMKSVMEHVDLTLYDVKHMDSEKHKKYTGVNNERILDNLIKLSNEMRVPVIARTPIIPGYNDSDENIHAMGKFLAEKIPTCVEVNLLPYHRLGESKTEQLEQDKGDFYSESPSDGEMDRLKTIITEYGLKAK
jgi:pyruvate formate lyase activating enzyme